jgi:SAM-dependent methyltransferase
MAKVPPAGVIAVAEKARAGLSSLRQKMVPPNIALLDFINDFWGFNIAFALAELRALDALARGPRASGDAARELGVDADHLYRLYRAGSMIGLVKEEAGRAFSLKPMGEALCAHPTASFRDFILFMGRYGSRFWRRLPDCVREGKTAIELETGHGTFDWLRTDPEASECFNRAMTAVSNVACEAIAAAYDFGRFTRIVDVGGGHGRLLAEILKHAPKARGVLFDLPDVVEGAHAVLTSVGVAERVERSGGSFFEGVPEAGDLYVAKTIIHDWQDAEARKILQSVRRAMRPDATLLLFETVVTAANQPHFAKLLDIEMIVHGGGRERSESEYRELLKSAGFVLSRIVPTAGPLSIIEARPG